jgi:hypothetical protein
MADVRRNHLDNPQGDRTEFNWCAISTNYLAGHIGFVPQAGFVPMTLDLGQSTKNGNICKP